MPPGTPSGFPVAQVFREEGSESDVPFADGPMADLDAALVQEFLSVSLAEGKAVVEPDRVLDDAHRKSMAVGFRFSHCRSA